MQLNIYVPKDKEKLLNEIERLAHKEQLSKNEIILAALERYLQEHLCQEVRFGVYSLGVKAKSIDRHALYREYLNRKLSTH